MARHFLRVGSLKLKLRSLSYRKFFAFKQSPTKGSTGKVPKSNGGIAASDVIRSMKRLGFADDEVYDTLTGIGLPGEQVHLLIDRVSAEFQEAKLEPRTSRLGAEVREIFRETFDDARFALLARIDALSRELQLSRNELEKLNERVVELQALMVRVKTSARDRKRGNLGS